MILRNEYHTVYNCPESSKEISSAVTPSTSTTTALATTSQSIKTETENTNNVILDLKAYFDTKGLLGLKLDGLESGEAL